MKCRARGPRDHSAPVGVAESRQARWFTVRIDVDAPVRDVATGGATRADVVVMCGDQPIGRFEFPVPIDPYPADLLAGEIRARFGGEIRRERLRRMVRPPAPGQVTRYGVLVCTRDRPDDLAKCLDSIEALDPPPCEVLVVDNASRDSRTRDIVAARGGMFRYLHEPHPGLDRARNRGLNEASSEVVVCTDDDVQVDVSWAKHLVACFDDPLVMAATGLVLPASLDTEIDRLAERVGGFARGFRRRVVDGTRVSPYVAGSMGAGASMAFRTDFLRSVGGFPEELDAGMPTGSGGDTYALAEVLRHGYRIVYEPSAVAWHAHRASEFDLRKALRGYGTGSVSYLTTAGLRHRDPGALLRGGRYWFGYMILKLLRGNDRGVPRALALAEARGALDAVTALPKARKLVAGRPPLVIEPPRHDAGAAPPRPLALPAKVTHELPSISIVIPSRGRRDSLVRLIGSLEQQRYPDGLAELIVVLDGDVDGSTAAVQQLRTRLPLELVTLSAPGGDRNQGNGAAAARNAGAARAKHDLLLFLDDDVEPTTKDLILSHAAEHADAVAARGVATIGPCLPRIDGDDRSLLSLTMRNWWTDHVGRLQTCPSLTFADVSTGNLAVSRSSFVEVGGFATMPRREDWEFGYRLVQHGVELRSASGAAVLHDVDTDLANCFEDRFREGRGDAAIVRDHPELFGWLPLASWDSMARPQRSAARSVMNDPGRRRLAVAVALRLLPRAEQLGLRDRYSTLLSTTSFACYWAGVGTESGGASGWLSRRDAAHRASPPPVALTLERAGDWRAPLPGEASAAIVSSRDDVLGVAPTIWGGAPWSRTRFLENVIGNFADSADAVARIRFAASLVQRIQVAT